MTVTSPTAGSPSTARPRVAKLVAALVGVMLLVAGLSFVVPWATGPAPGPHHEKGDPDAPEHYADPIVISVDTTWTGQTAVLARTVEIKAASTLRVVGCNLTVLFEDLIIKKGPWFKVDSGASLEFVNSTVRVEADPHLGRAVLATRPDLAHIESGHLIPGTFLSRALDLVGAKDPVLSFDASWRGVPSDLLVAAQARPGAELLPLEVIKAPAPRFGEWLHYDVPLASLAGGVPRIAIAPVSGTWDALLMSDVRVTDGGADPVGDAFPTGIATHDGWEADGFDPVMDFALVSFKPSELVTSEGSLVFTDSTIGAPNGIPRWNYMRSGIPQYQRLDPRGLATEGASRGATIESTSGCLTVERSNVTHVPILAQDSNVSIADSWLAGTADLLTMDRCRSRVVGSTLTTLPLRALGPLATGSDPERRLGWAVLAGNGTPGGMEVFKDDVFAGSDVALALLDVDSDVAGCSFVGVSRLCLWSHESTGSSDWEAVAATCDFEACTGARYLATGECRVEYGGPAYVPVDRGQSTAWLRVRGGPALPDVPYDWLGSSGGSLALPQRLVDAAGLDSPIATANVTIYPPWGGYAYGFDVGTGLRSWMVDFPIMDPYEGLTQLEYVLRLTHFLSPTLHQRTVPGTVNLTIGVNFWAAADHVSAEGLGLNVSLDGAPLRTFDVLAEGGTGGVNEYYYNLSMDLSLPEGPSQLRLAVSGRVVDENATREFHNLTLGVMRVSNATTLAAVEGFLSGGGTYLLLDPGVAMALPGVPAFPMIGWNGADVALQGALHALLWEGTHLTVGGQGSGPNTFMEISGNGPGHLEVSGVECFYLTIDELGGGLEVQDVHASYFFISASHSTAHAANATSLESASLAALEGADLTCERCSLGIPDGGISATSSSSIRLVDCAIKNGGTGFIIIPTIGNGSSLTISGCVFDGVSMWFALPATSSGPGHHLSVTGCTFRDEPGYIRIETVDVDPMNATWPEGWAISGDRFVGPSAGIIVPPPLAARLASSSLFEQGASVLVDYDLVLDLQVQPGDDVYDTPISIDTLWPIGNGRDAFQMMGVSGSALTDHLFLNLTGDPTKAMDPGKVQLPVRGGYSDVLVLWFADVDPLAGRETVISPPMERMTGPLGDLITKIIGGTIFWTR